MKIAVAGTGYVGLVTGVALAYVGHDVSCVDVDEKKIEMLNNGISPIYEEGLEDLMSKSRDNIEYTTDYKKAYKNAEVIFIGVGTPERADGSANLDYVNKVCEQIAESIERDCVVVVKSTVPIGTNDIIEKYLRSKVKNNVKVYVASNPEFLAEGTAVRDTLYASRIVVGTEHRIPERIMKKLYSPLTKKPYKVPYLATDRRSAEMVKYASNDFLALKVSYINEIANFCEKVGADITDVTKGMGLDPRIGNKFLNAGIGYGGSCFPKDTKALHWLSKEMDKELKTVSACIEVNKNQKIILYKKLQEIFNDLNGKNIAVLGLTFKPGTDDLREAPSIDNIELLLESGANVKAYDPIGISNFKNHISFETNNGTISYFDNIDDAIINADAVMIMTEWPQIKEYDINKYEELMNTPYILDGRNCYDLSLMSKTKAKYLSIGRKKINFDKK